MDIIGVCGRKRHGKDSVGKSIREHHGHMTIAFADPIKRIAMDLWGLSYEQVYGGPGVDREEVDPRWGISPRHIMQQLGTEVARSIHQDTWTRYCFDLIEQVEAGEDMPIHIPERKGFFPVSWLPEFDRKSWVITDIRFDNECDAIRERGGHVIKVTRPSLMPQAGEDLHASETGIDAIKPDYDVLNDGTLDDLGAKVRGVMVRLNALRGSGLAGR